MQLEEFPKAIRDLGQILNECRKELASIEASLKFRKAHIQVFGEFEAPVSRREPELILKLLEDKEYKALILKESELRERISKVELDQDFLKHSFSVSKLRLREKLIDDTE